MINPNSCIICSSTDIPKLNTEFKITVDDKQVVVKVCDEHADDTTVKMAKEKYLEKLSAVEVLIAQAKALGLDFSFDKPATAIAMPTKREVIAPKPVPQAVMVEEEEEQEDAVIVNKDLGKLDSIRLPNIRTEGNVSGVANAINLTSAIRSENQEVAADLLKLTNNGVAKVKVVETRKGIQMPITSERRDGLGTTRIAIDNKMTDSLLQEDFKKKSQQSKEGMGFGSDGYDTERTCPMCQGTGRIRKTKVSMIVCPKCDGGGVIMV